MGQFSNGVDTSTFPANQKALFLAGFLLCSGLNVDRSEVDKILREFCWVTWAGQILCRLLCQLGDAAEQDSNGSRHLGALNFEIVEEDLRECGFSRIESLILRFSSSSDERGSSFRLNSPMDEFIY